jgi:transposase-like protein
MATLWLVDGGHPVRGQHYPGSQQEFERWFASEQRARAYVEAVRFRNSKACPFCEVIELAAAGRGRWWCSACRRHVTLTAGTVMQGTRVPLRTWLAACWHMTQSKPGISATSISAMYGVPYNSAWTLLQKIRSGMDQSGRDKLSGDIEIDECWVGGVDPGVPGKSSAKKSVVLVAVEVLNGGVKMGRIRMERVLAPSAIEIMPFLERHIEPGSVLYSDGNDAYVVAINRLAAKGLHYKLDQTIIFGNPAPTSSLLLHVHRVISLMKRWLLGTFQGAVRGQHLDAYLDEFVFKFNRRSSRSRGLLFYRLVCELTDPRSAVRYDELRDRAVSLKAAEAAWPARKQAHEKLLESEKNARAYRRRKAGISADDVITDLEPDSISIADVEAF